MFLPWATGCQPSSLPTPPPGVPPALEPSGLLGTLWLTRQLAPWHPGCQLSGEWIKK